MGALADLQAQAKTFKPASPLGQWIVSELKKRVDAAVPTDFAKTAAVHNLAQDTVDHTGGTFTITVKLRNGETFTTDAQTFSASAAAIQSEVDIQGASFITGYVAGDIAVAGGNLQTADVTLTFSGASVEGEHPITVFNDSMTGGTSPSPRVTITEDGQTNRPAWAVLLNLGVISGTPPLQTAIASTSAVTRGPNLVVVPDVIVKALMREAAAEDQNNGAYFSLQSALYPQDRAPLVATRVASDVLPS